MTQAEQTRKPGEAKLKHLFAPGRIGGFATRNRIKYGACCVSGRLCAMPDWPMHEQHI
jgi:hypothetical protein